MTMHSRGGSLRALRDSDWFEDVPHSVEDEQYALRGWDVVHVGSRDYDIDVVALLSQAQAFTWSPKRTDEQVAQRFETLRGQWAKETRMHSSLHKKVTHPAYQEIIGLGPQVVPHIVDALRVRPDHWFWALRAIVGEDHAAGASGPAEAASRWVGWYDARA